MHPSFVSGGRKVNWEKSCQYPKCVFLEEGKDRDGGWCTNPENRTSPTPHRPTGFTPSVASNGWCELHTIEVKLI